MPTKTPRTKIVGYLLILIAVANTAVDALNGGGFDFKAHINDLAIALGGSGLVFVRDAILKIENKIIELLKSGSLPS